MTIRELTMLTRQYRLVLCHGCFDPLHIGHIRHFQAAKKFAQTLVVTVTPDRFVNKPGRPIFPEALRLEAVRALRCVDFAAINEWPTAVETIQALRPLVYCKGAETDRASAVLAEQAAVEACGGRLVFTEELTFSSTKLLEQILHG